MAQLQTKPQTDRWVVATWDEYIQVIEDAAYKQAKGYYYDRQMRIESMPTGTDHAGDHSIILFAVSLFSTLNNISQNGLVTCSYRKTGVQECQPDLSYYIGEQTKLTPQGGVVDLNVSAAPDLAIEVSNTTLSDDLGRKRLLYEEMGIPEYWVVDVQNQQVIAFEILNNGSRRITQSQVLPGLNISVLEEALNLSRQVDQSRVGNWLISQFQQK